MGKLVTLLVCSLALNAAASAQVPAGSAATGSVELRLRHGDDVRWAARDWDDSGWQRIRSNGFPARAGVYWVRVHLAPGAVELGGSHRYSFNWPLGQEIDAIFLAAVYSFELYWDGRLLQRGGTVGRTREAEATGPLDHLIRIPDDLRGAGEHVVALRVSSYHYNFSATHFAPGFALTEYSRRLLLESRQPVVPLMLLAGAILMAATSMVMFLFAERRRSLIICALLSLALALFYGLIAFRWLYNAPYDWHAPRLAAIALTTAVISGLLVWLLAEQFGVMRRGQWLVGLAPLLGLAWWASPIYEIKALWICRAMVVVALGVVGWAALRRRPGARWVFGMLLLGLFFVQTSNRSFLDPVFFLFLEGLVFFVFVALGVQVRAERFQARELALTTARLETELLKKNIQPHFLLNTLATIIELIEQAPHSAVSLIEALSSEFRILARVSGEKLIPLAQELDLCRAHLAIMSLRQNVRCSLATEGIEPDIEVPPALFHTLIENGMTHLAPRAGEQRFTVAMSRAHGALRFAVTAYGKRRPETARVAGAAANGHAREGTGTRYIRARLEESFPGRWNLQAGPVVDGWETVIELTEQRPKVGRSSQAPVLAQ